MDFLTTEQLEFIKLLVSEIAIMSPSLIAIFLIIQGIKCLLRSEMLRIYYHNKDNETIRQYENENFIALYKAYKALRGNSFIDKIHKEIMSWKVIS